MTDEEIAAALRAEYERGREDMRQRVREVASEYREGGSFQWAILQILNDGRRAA